MYRKTFITFSLVIIASMPTRLYAQNKFEVVSGNISFSSNAPLELIQASSESIKGIVDPATRKFAFIVKMSSFKGFNSELQREHFNENYLETDKYYDATFTGELQGDSFDFSKDGIYKVLAKGAFIVHGKKQARTIPGIIRIAEGRLSIESDFKVLL
ncbi:MAG: hypothetical protein L0Y35_09270, partial [Flammeovirgaceae bacterium]|nr:hypothetical protein [Flammeovirgaceae bacterium]